MNAAVEAESGIVYLGPFGEFELAAIQEELAGAEAETLGDPLTCVRVTDPRAAYDATGLLLRLSATAPQAAIVAFFVDAKAGAEGVRVFQGGSENERRELVWAEAEAPDPAQWPVGSLAMTFGLKVEALTRVPRPGRPPLIQVIEALLSGAAVETEDPKLLQQAVELLGQIPIPPATAALVAHLQHDDWVVRYHAAKGYARIERQQGQEGQPRLESILEDEDEGVREALFQGFLELLPEVDFSASALIEQIDVSLERGLEDEDEDVREMAEQAAELRARLLG